ncbi:MAG: D-2-hydroxyacid dehydrogenase [Lentisphaeria bacterium]|nr:D-2-hydroxyacid dehydrogenase [Lentisphaeria bacterium]
MKIVVLDGHTLKPNESFWPELSKFGDVTIYPRSSPEEIAERIQDAEVILTNKAVLSRMHILANPQIKLIQVLATGYNVVDVDAAKEANIPVVNIPSYSGPAVAQTVFAHILNFANNLERHSEAVLNSKAWTNSPDFSFWFGELFELKDKTIGLVGFGAIAKAVAKIALGFEMKVLVYRKNTLEPAPDGVQYDSLDQIFKKSDFISLHCPLTTDTTEMINKITLQKMKPSSYLINTGRGALVNEEDLSSALKNGSIAGAGLDVLSCEPPNANNPLLSAPNVQITPHYAWASKEARQRLYSIMLGNIKEFLEKKPLSNQVN